MGMEERFIVGIWEWKKVYSVWIWAWKKGLYS